MVLLSKTDLLFVEEKKFLLKAKFLSSLGTSLAIHALSNGSGRLSQVKYICALIFPLLAQKVSLELFKLFSVEECLGKCQNNGVCSNGECKCRKNYSGQYCQYKEDDASPILWYIFIFLVMVFVIVLLFFASWFLLKQVVSVRLS